MNENKGVFGVNMGHLWGEIPRLRSMMDEVVGLVGAGKLDPVVDKVFPFDKAADAHRFLQSRKNVGKVLLTP